MCLLLAKKNIEFYTRKLKKAVIKELACKCIRLKSIDGVAQTERLAFCMVARDAIGNRSHQIILLVS